MKREYGRGLINQAQICHEVKVYFRWAKCNFIREGVLKGKVNSLKIMSLET